MASGSQEISRILWHLDCSQKPATSAYTGPDEASPRPSILFFEISFNIIRLIKKTSVKHVVLLINRLKTQLDVLH
jgi:hypothetical protein